MPAFCPKLDDLFGVPLALSGPLAAEFRMKMQALRASGFAPSASLLDAFQQATDEAMRAWAIALGGRPGWAAGMRYARCGRVAVLPLWGLLAPYPTGLEALGMGTDTRRFAAAHLELLAEPGVKAIAWSVDSGGGTVAGTPEAFAQLLAARGRKPTVAVSDTVMASAAYWLASAADQIVASPSSLTGSVGVVIVHRDRSGANAKAGVGVTYIHAGKFKVEGNPDEPLGGEARAAMQQIVDDFYAKFVRDVAQGRRATELTVRGRYGEGRVLTDRNAVQAGLADRRGTLPAEVARLQAAAG